ncbi:hypothetical protein H0H87_011952 [Tephrocybe sp. NHM501043]|nr:hypothetical protein H0H87_011952 [Tephrocybe sp. NHM501043]
MSLRKVPSRQPDLSVLLQMSRTTRSSARVRNSTAVKGATMGKPIAHGFHRLDQVTRSSTRIRNINAARGSDSKHELREDVHDDEHEVDIAMSMTSLQNAKESLNRLGDSPSVQETKIRGALSFGYPGISVAMIDSEDIDRAEAPIGAVSFDQGSGSSRQGSTNTSISQSILHLFPGTDSVNTIVRVMGQRSPHSPTEPQKCSDLSAGEERSNGVQSYANGPATATKIDQSEGSYLRCPYYLRPVSRES